MGFYEYSESRITELILRERALFNTINRPKMLRKELEKTHDIF